MSSTYTPTDILADLAKIAVEDALKEVDVALEKLKAAQEHLANVTLALDNIKEEAHA